MLGKTDHPPCGRCCGAPGHDVVKTAKRRERAAVQREAAAEYLEYLAGLDKPEPRD